MNRLCIIPARGGSKRIPRKTIRPFLGKPILAYGIETARQSGLFGEVMVSTDDDDVAVLARQYGADVPFLRSAKAAGDYATTADVLLEVLHQYEQQGQTFEYGCCLYATAPFVTPDLLRQGFERLQTGGFDCVLPVQRFSFPIQRALRLNQDRLTWFQPEHALTRSQDLAPAYHDAGQFYWFNVATFRQSGRLLPDNSGGIVISELQAQDIDNETDWQLAELKYQLTFPNRPADPPA